ncbi:hypothetical protein [Planosporangium thailandense]|uniref:hypothetical protein n=1 Tax=Planosporangium thailandense TaxID=765197 RepID=UPI00197BCCE6|nr:hypothetical protein [Planosporangium thailandense]
MPVNVEAVRAEALFVSPLQSSDQPKPDQVLRAVATALRRFGARGCAVRVAGEFGEHPETAVSRMEWALNVIRTVYPAPVDPAALRPEPALCPEPALRPEPAPQQPLALAG